MGNRLSKIYTRTGDDGTTGLGDGSRTNKDGERISCIGSVDELNSIVGLLIAELGETDSLAETLKQIQNDLFDLGGELSVPGYSLIEEGQITWLEEQTDALNEPLPPLKNFILPGGSRATATAHLARSVCRRAEREIVRLSRQESVNTPPAHYLNRLSDLLFVAARSISRRNGGEEVLWQQKNR